MSIGGGAYRRRHGPPGLRRASGGREAGKMSTGAELGGAARLGPAPRESEVKASSTQERTHYYIVDKRSHGFLFDWPPFAITDKSKPVQTQSDSEIKPSRYPQTLIFI